MMTTELESRLEALEVKRNECAHGLKLAQMVLERATITHEYAKQALEDAQRQVNHVQMMLDDTENDIRRVMALLRGEAV